jgi:hypothetical protein
MGPFAEKEIRQMIANKTPTWDINTAIEGYLIMVKCPNFSNHYWQTKVVVPYFVDIAEEAIEIMKKYNPSEEYAFTTWYP